MKNKNLIEHDVMFCSLDFKALPNKVFDYANLIKVCVKTNGNIIRITMNNNISYVETLVTKAHILDNSNEFYIYELPIENFRMFKTFTKESSMFYNNNIHLESIAIDVESKTEGPFEVEIKYLDICFDDNLERFQKDKMPIFKKINNDKKI